LRIVFVFCCNDGGFNRTQNATKNLNFGKDKFF